MAWGAMRVTTPQIDGTSYRLNIVYFIKYDTFHQLISIELISCEN